MIAVMGTGQAFTLRSPVSWGSLLLALGVLVALSAAVGAGVAYWLLLHYSLLLPLQGQDLQVRLPDQLPVEVALLPPDPGSPGPMQDFPVRINEHFNTLVRVDTQLPLRMTVPFKTEVPVDITLPLNTRVRTRVLGLSMELPIEGEIPLRFKLPVNLMIPIDQVLPMKFNLPVSTHINQTVNVQLQTRQSALITLHQPVLPVTLQGQAIAVPLSGLSLVSQGETAVPGPVGAADPRGHCAGDRALPPCGPHDDHGMIETK